MSHVKSAIKRGFAFFTLKGRRLEVRWEEAMTKKDEVWKGVEMCDCHDPICQCSPLKSQIAALRYALYTYWVHDRKPVSRFMIPQFEKQYGYWKDQTAWRSFVMDVFSHNNLKAVEIIDAYRLNG